MLAAGGQVVSEYNDVWWVLHAIRRAPIPDLYRQLHSH